MSDEYSQPGPDGNAERPTPLRIDILTLFPGMFVGPFDHSIIARGRESGVIDLHVHDLRGWAQGKHHQADDYAYGGGGGMVMLPEPVFLAVESLLGIAPISAASPGRPPHPVVLMSPQGQPFDHALASSLAGHDRLVIVCGHYEGYDERIREHLATHEVSVGDFVVTGGEIPAMLVTDAVARLRPGVVGCATGTDTDSFATGLLEHPHYTRPADFRGYPVPDVLVSGNHGAIERWRRVEALRRTLERRPEYLTEANLQEAERRLLEEMRDSIAQG